MSMKSCLSSKVKLLFLECNSIVKNVKLSECKRFATPSYFASERWETLEAIQNNFTVIENFVNEDEERSLMSEIDPVFKRRRYEYDHWDGAIQGYKETEKIGWNADNKNIIQRVRDIAFSPDTPQLHLVHVLDLAKDGHIKPHIDSIRFCGDTIAGISLLSSCIMRLVNEDNKTCFVDILLGRRSLYIMKGVARYKFTHEILAEKEALFNGKFVQRNRRISVICRNEPKETCDNL